MDKQEQLIKTRPSIGQKVKANAHIRKCRRNMGAAEGYDTKLTWERWKTKVEGYYIGYRDVREGRITYYGVEEGSGFSQDRTIRAWLIVPNERMNAIYILPEDVVMVSWEFL